VLPLPRSPLTRRIVLAYTVNRFGTWFGNIALAIFVYDRTHNELAVAALLIAGEVVSGLLVPALIARVETRRRPHGLSALYGTEALAVGLLAVLASVGFSLPVVLILVAIDGTAALTANALLRTAAARSAREWAEESARESGADAKEADRLAWREERVANSTLNLGFAATFALGPVLAGLAVPAFGVSAALWFDVATFLVCAALMLHLTPTARTGARVGARERIRAARQHLDEVPALRLLFVAEAVALTFFTFGGPLQVAYAKTTLAAGDAGYGLLAATWGVGVTFGSVLFARSSERTLLSLLMLGTLAVGVAYVGFWAAPSLAVAAPSAFVGGVGNGMQWASLIGSVQRMTPRALYGQMMGAAEVLGSVAPAVGYTLAGLIAVHTNPRVGFLVAGLGAIGSLLLFARLRHGALSARSATA